MARRMISGVASSSTSRSAGLDPTMHPELQCGCGLAAANRTAGTPRNYGRRFFSCPRRESGCHLWIWEDLLFKFVEEMNAYIRCSTIDYLKEQLQVCRSQILEKDKLIERQTSDLMSKDDELKSVSRKISQTESKLLVLQRSNRLLKLVLFLFVFNWILRMASNQ